MGILSNYTVIITGAGSGLGKASALMFAKEGAKVVLCGRTAKKIDHVKDEIIAQGGQAIAVTADVSEPDQVSDLINQAIEAFGSVDILINNAAVLENGTVFDTHLDAWNYQITNNLTTVLLTTQACLPYMRKQKFGRIVNLTSALAVNGAGGFAAYSASKAGVESLTRTTADEEKEHQIKVYSFDPGTIRTEMHATGRDPVEVVPQLIKLCLREQSEESGKLISVN
jgi:3-oxoacyl-[acyl-carrier protein] reductase